MSLSYSFHLSSKSHALGTTNSISGASKHNLRAYESANYDKSQIEILRGAEDRNILDSVQKIYDEEFRESVFKYNQKQLENDHKERCITDYLQKVNDSKNDVAAEIIIQIGSQDDWKDISLEDRKKMTPVFEEQINKLEELCPNFKIANATIHYDEQSPHMHVIGVPVAEGYKKGLERQCSKTKVFTKDSLEMLQDKMRDGLSERVRALDLFEDPELTEKKQGRNYDVPKNSLAKLQAQQNKIEMGSKILEMQQKNVQKNINTIESQKAEIGAKNNEIEDLERTLEDKSTALEKTIKEVQELDNSQKEKAGLLDKLMEQIKELQAQISQLFAQIRELTKQRDKLTKENERLQKQADRVKTKDIETGKTITGKTTIDDEDLQTLRAKADLYDKHSPELKKANKILKEAKSESEHMKKEANKILHEAKSVTARQLNKSFDAVLDSANDRSSIDDHNKEVERQLEVTLGWIEKYGFTSDYQKFLQEQKYLQLKAKHDRMEERAYERSRG